MTIGEALGERINEHLLVNSQQESAEESKPKTAYEVVNTCFDSITLIRKKEKDWGIVAKQLMSSFEAVTGQKMSITPYTLKYYYYKIRSTSGSKKKKKSKPSAVKSPPVIESAAVVEVATVDDIPPEVDSASPEKTDAEIPKDTVATAGKRRKKAADAHGGFQVPRRPGFTPPVHISGL